MKRENKDPYELVLKLRTVPLKFWKCFLCVRKVNELDPAYERDETGDSFYGFKICPHCQGNMYGARGWYFWDGENKPKKTAYKNRIAHNYDVESQMHSIYLDRLVEMLRRAIKISKKLGPGVQF